MFEPAYLKLLRSGLRLPLVYNTGGYDSLEALALLDGIVDIYMPDGKYASDATAHQYSKIRHYASVNRAAVKEMHRQVGDLQQDERGIAERGCWCATLYCPTTGLGRTPSAAGSGRRSHAIPMSISWTNTVLATRRRNTPN